jgi:hypothetical protein
MKEWKEEMGKNYLRSQVVLLKYMIDCPIDVLFKCNKVIKIPKN